MEDNTTNNEDIFSRWLAGKLSESERQKLESSGDLEILKRIVSKVDQWTLPELKAQYEQKLLARISAKKEAKVIPFYRRKLTVALAACTTTLLGCLAVYLIFFSTKLTTYTCQSGQKLDLILPDQTKVTLNGQSSISFNESTWADKRELTLTGEGYFEVTKKGPFRVQFAQGTVDVLGTRFNILSGGLLTSVKCYEGKVLVTQKDSTGKTLEAGEATRLSAVNAPESYAVDSQNPEWMKGESVFTNAPLLEVITSLSVQYNLQFDTNETNLERKFTGKFNHTDVDAALKAVFTPMGIKYTLEDKRMVVLK